MNELGYILPVSVRPIGQERVNAVDGRTLHSFLGNRELFATWIQDRIRKYEFVEGTDFETFLVNSKKGRPSRDYLLTLSMAKELAMVERTERGKQARLYFIECERMAVRATVAPSPANLSRLELLTMAMEAEKERLALACKVEVLQPKAAALDRLSSAAGSVCITDAAKSLKVRPQYLFAWLSTHDWIYRRMGYGRSWVAYQQRIDTGHMEHRAVSVERPDGSEKLVEQTLVTAKGLAKLGELIGLSA